MKWQPIETAPKDKLFIGLRGNHVAPTQHGRHYVKWPHQDGGPTYREVWNETQYDSVTPWSPTHWIPFPERSDLE